MAFGLGAVSPASAVKLAGNIAPIVSSGVYLAPVPTIRNVVQDRSVKSLPLLPYSSMTVNAFMWMTYGILKKDKNVIAPNAFGFFCALNYFFHFQKYSPKASPTLPGSLSQHKNSTLFMIAVTTLTALLLNPTTAANIIGKTGVVFCVLLFSSPLAAMKTVCMTRNASSIPLPFTLTCILNCFLWTVYGYFDVNDFNIYFPNFLGLLSSLAQFALIMFYGTGEKSLPL